MGYLVPLWREAEAVKRRQEAAFERCRENCMCGKDALCAEGCCMVMYGVCAVRLYGVCAV